MTMINFWLLLLTLLYSLFWESRWVYGDQTSPGDMVQPFGFEQAMHRFEFYNDAFFGKDNKLTNGLSIQHHTAIAKSWDELSGVPDFVRRWGSHIPTLSADGLNYRSGIAIGQVIQTPGDLSRRELILDDVPYAGALTLQAVWYAYNDDEYRGFEITTGVVGPLSLGEQTQQLIHMVIGPDPKGWSNQLSNEPILNINYMRKKKLWRYSASPDFSFDVVINGDVGLGNLFTQMNVAIEMRFGNNIPKGFLYVPDPIGFSMHYKATLRPLYPKEASRYGALVLRGTGSVHNIFLDGNTFKDSHHVEKKSVVGQAIASFHYELPEWSIRFNLSLTTDNVDTVKSPDAESSEKLGSITFEWRL